MLYSDYVKIIFPYSPLTTSRMFLACVSVALLTCPWRRRGALRFVRSGAEGSRMNNCFLLHR